MFAWEILKRIPWQAIAIVVVCVTLWFSGEHHGRQVVEAKWNAEKTAAALAQAKREEAYELQLAAANTERDNNRAELDRVRDLSHARILCKRAPSSAVPDAPSSSSDTSSGGILPPPAGFDPTDALYDLADQADSAVETAREALALWPE